MVLRKRPDYRINAFPGPVIPRGPRSVRKWSPHKKNVEDGQNYAFELLASIAGKLLLESESSISSNASEGKDRPIIERDNIIKQEQSDEDKPSKPELVEKFSFRNYCNKIEGGSPDYGESNNIENGIEKQQGGKELEIGNLKKEYYAKSQAMLILDSNVKLPLPSDAISGSSFSTHSNGINKLGSRDDDQNFSGCYKPSTKFNSFRPSSRIVGRRIRKLLNSKYWKVAPKLRDCEVSRSGFVDGGMKPFYRKRKMCYGDRCQCNTSYKRRRCFDRSSVVTAYGGMSSESVSNSPEKGLNIDKSASSAMLHGGPSSSSESSHVKFSIKSFKVPEFFIDVPEDATVGSLKRTVMETVTAIFGSGLHVGVLLQGKKIWDDNTTLSETGLSSKENLDTLGFTLEPNPLQPSPVTYPTEDPPPHLPRDPSNLLTRSTYGALPETSLTNTVNNDESNNESVSSLNDMLTEKSSAYSKALVVVPEISMGPLNVVAPVNQKKNAWEMSMEGLAVVPANPKTKNSELAQRRTRRPFSVTEVEALVEAVEELGTGRWRDVKIRSFENADHRTYVDLKDKWKTLVHTARISPQQRRGEPVPQELLDRVLAAHAYWAQHQAKQYGKSQGGNLKIAEAPADGRGAEAIQLP